MTINRWLICEKKYCPWIVDRTLEFSRNTQS